MDAIGLFLLQFDAAWEHEWESLTSVLSGVGDDEANWQAPCYRDTPATDDWPARGTIRWQVAHIAHCKREYAARLRSAEKEGPSPNLPHRPTGNYEEDLHELRQAHADQRAAIARLGADCYFADCQHATEPKCAVKQAVERGEMPAERLANFHKLQAEQTALLARQDTLAQQDRKKRDRQGSKAVRNYYQLNPQKGQK